MESGRSMAMQEARAQAFHASIARSALETGAVLGRTGRRIGAACMSSLAARTTGRPIRSIAGPTLTRGRSGRQPRRIGAVATCGKVATLWISSRRTSPTTTISWLSWETGPRTPHPAPQPRRSRPEPRRSHQPPGLRHPRLRRLRHPRLRRRRLKWRYSIVSTATTIGR